MIRGPELIGLANEIINADAKPSEAALRSAVSRAYYGLFRTLGAAAIAALAGTDPDVQRRFARLYDHSAFKRICRDLQQERVESRSEAGRAMLPEKPHPKLVLIARCFTALVTAREAADYDLCADVTPSYAVERVRLAAEAVRALKEVEDLPETRRFLLALFLADRWPRRG